LSWYRTKSNTFTCPDSSDVEDEEYEISDDNIEGNEGSSSDDGISIGSRPVKASQAINAIDLTRDDFPAASSGDEESNDEERCKVKNIRYLIAGIDSDDQTKTEFYPRIISDSDDEEVRSSSSSGSNLHSDDSGSDDSGSLDGYGLEEAEGSEIHDTFEDPEMNVETHSAPGSPKIQSRQADEHANFGPSTSSSDEDMRASSIELAARILASESIMSDEDDESDFGLSESGREGIQALFDDGLLENGDADHYGELRPEDESNTDSVMSGKGPINVAANNDENERLKRGTSLFQPAEMPPQTISNFDSHHAYECSALPMRDPFSQSTTGIRQPSPSDAAMVKTAISLSREPSQASNPSFVRSSPVKTTTWEQLLAESGVQSLGDKTGKHAFFEAREDNKAKFYATEDGVISKPPAGRTMQGSESTGYQEQKPQHKVIVATPSTERRQGRYTRSLSSVDSYDAAEPSVIPPHSPGMVKAAGSCKFLITDSRTVSLTARADPPLSYVSDGTQVPIFERDPSPLLDMTSAFEYNKSKASMAAASKEASSQPGRSKLSIRDIIDSSTADQTKDKKRKADEISNVIEDEVRIWAASSSLDASIGSTDMPASGSEVVATPKLPGVKQDVEPNLPEQRSAKRLKRIVEGVGYAALGGAVVGAGLFSVLVATAPDFL
jgi:hypothetical protein